MNAFLKQILDLTLSRDAEHKKRREETEAKKLKKWQAFRNNYETVALALQAVDGMKCHPFKENDPEKRQDRTLRVRRVEELPSAPPDGERVCIVEMHMIWVGKGTGKDEFFAGWVTRWSPYHDELEKHTYDEKDQIWRGLHDDKMYSQEHLLSSIVKDLASRIDPACYVTTEPPPNGRPIDL